MAFLQSMCSSYDNPAERYAIYLEGLLSGQCFTQKYHKSAYSYSLALFDLFFSDVVVPMFGFDWPILSVFDAL